MPDVNVQGSNEVKVPAHRAGLPGTVGAHVG